MVGFEDDRFDRFVPDLRNDILSVHDLRFSVVESLRQLLLPGIIEIGRAHV